jgi:hypothetical protein
MINIGKTQTRREFIKKSALTSGIIPIVYIKGPSFIHSKTSFDEDAINKFRKSFNGHIILPGDTEYEVKRRVGMMNPMMDKHPALIASCKEMQSNNGELMA